MTSAVSKAYRGQTHIDFIGKRKLWFAISGLVVLACAALLATRGLNFGIEFIGGVQIQAPIPEAGPLGDAEDTEVISTLRDALQPFGASGAQIQVARDGEARSVIVQTKEVEDPEAQQEVIAAVAEAIGVSVEQTDNSRIGSKWGGEITEKALRALVVFVVVVVLFISWRFEWKMALAAVTALFHDLMITAGVYSAVGFEVTPSTVIALLTILGYSLYDTVVVFDKVEENTSALAATGKVTYESAANGALNQVFMRSLNTSLTTLLPVGALLFVGAGLLGASTLEDLALALLVGIGAGTYSSIFVATPVLSILKEREPRYAGVREKVLREARRARPSPPEAAEAVAPVQAPSQDKVGPTRKSEARAPARDRAGSKKARRRRRR